MKEMYLNVLKDDKKLNYLISPIKWSKNGALTPCDLPSPPQEEGDYSLLDCSYFLMEMVRDFPGRTIDDIKVGINKDEEFLIYSVDMSFINNGWYGVTIIRTNKEQMPPLAELSCSHAAYEVINNYFTNNNLLGRLMNDEQVGLNGLSEELFSCFKVLKSKCDLTSTLSDLVSEKNNEYQLEGTFANPGNVLPKWDFFAVSLSGGGAPLTNNILRYYPKRQIFSPFKVLDNEREYDLPKLGRKPLSDIHSFNCFGLYSCYSFCDEMTKYLKDVKSAELKLINTKLYRRTSEGFIIDIGNGFSFVEKAVVNNVELIGCLDVKNRLRDNQFYFKKLTSQEERTLKKICRSIEKQGSLEQDDIFRIAERIIGENTT
ncbi:hypothetical protein GF352_04275 [archaeon]|nr:hypothetical protein [archaeon]